MAISASSPITLSVHTRASRVPCVYVFHQHRHVACPAGSQTKQGYYGENAVDDPSETFSYLPVPTVPRVAYYEGGDGLMEIKKQSVYLKDSFYPSQFEGNPEPKVSLPRGTSRRERRWANAAVDAIERVVQKNAALKYRVDGIQVSGGVKGVARNWQRVRELANVVSKSNRTQKDGWAEGSRKSGPLGSETYRSALEQASFYCQNEK
jgi:hypothetical protein